jgi:hypothetical protein
MPLKAHQTGASFHKNKPWNLLRFHRQFSQPLENIHATPLLEATIFESFNINALSSETFNIR